MSATLYGILTADGTMLGQPTNTPPALNDSAGDRGYSVVAILPAADLAALRECVRKAVKLRIEVVSYDYCGHSPYKFGVCCDACAAILAFDAARARVTLPEETTTNQERTGG